MLTFSCNYDKYIIIRGHQRRALGPCMSNVSSLTWYGLIILITTPGLRANTGTIVKLLINSYTSFTYIYCLLYDGCETWSIIRIDVLSRGGIIRGLSPRGLAFTPHGASSPVSIFFPFCVIATAFQMAPQRHNYTIMVKLMRVRWWLVEQAEAIIPHLGSLVREDVQA